MNQRQSRLKSGDISSSEESLPEYSQWTSVQKRLDHLEATVIKLQKHGRKLQRRMQEKNSSEEKLVRELKGQLEERMGGGSHIVGRQVELELQAIKEEMGELHSFIKRVEKKNSEMIRQLRNHSSSVIPSGSINEDELEKKLQEHYQHSRKYIDRAVNDFKASLRQHNKVQTPIVQTPIHHPPPRDSSLGLSRSTKNLSHEKSSSKLKASYRQNVQDLSIDTQIRTPKQQRTPKSTTNVNIAGNSRVSYLKEKLREFEEINKKYERVAPQEQRKVRKMRQMKDYLQQSESEAQVSNLDEVGGLAQRWGRK